MFMYDVKVVFFKISGICMHYLYLFLYGKHLLPKNDATKQHPNYAILVSNRWQSIELHGTGL